MRYPTFYSIVHRTIQGIDTTIYTPIYNKHIRTPKPYNRQKEKRAKRIITAHLQALIDTYTHVDDTQHYKEVHVYTPYVTIQPKVLYAQHIPYVYTHHIDAPTHIHVPLHMQSFIEIICIRYNGEKDFIRIAILHEKDMHTFIKSIRDSRNKKHER